jgi:hypothetical protein
LKNGRELAELVELLRRYPLEGRRIVAIINKFQSYDPGDVAVIEIEAAGGMTCAGTLDSAHELPI